MWRIALIELSSVLERARKQLTPYQLNTLLKRFQAKPFLEQGEKSQLARSLNISEATIAQWFQNRRKKKRRTEMLCK